MNHNKLIIKVITIEKNAIFDKLKLDETVKKLIRLNSNLMIFGLPNSGKSTLVKAICKESKEFQTLEDEEATDNEDMILLKQKNGKKWAVGHQFPTSHESISNEELKTFFTSILALEPKKWTIIRIISK